MILVGLQVGPRKRRPGETDVATRKSKVPKHQQGRVKQQINVTLDPDTIKRLDDLKKRHEL
jgi:hypothetical protein